ncbi:MAG: DUF3488 and transglutaminase-like domain-containing protein [Micropruina sp.]|uniref:transglutaminase family protein n=1 Tax=Micropruina sp. TaxID=2737536 RepID=UPI0039E329C9
MRASDRLGAAVAVAMALALTALTPVTADRAAFTDSLVLIAVIGAAGIVARRLLPGDLLAGVLQAVAGLATLAVLSVGAGLVNPFALPGVLSSALRWTVESAAPMQPNLGVRLVLTFAVGLLAFLADQLAVTHRHPGWTLLPLGVLYLVPALALPTLVGFESLIALGVGYLLILLAEAADRGRVLNVRTSGRSRGGLLLGGLICLLAALPSAVLAGMLTPGIDPDRGAPFTGQGPVQMGDPSLDLRRNLQLPVDRRVLTYTTSNGAGAQLRLTTLPGFDATGFHLNPIDLFGGALPAPPGAPPGRPRYTIEVAVDAFNSEWLPLPYAPAAFSASGDWRHDPITLSVLASGAKQKEATNGLHYQATVVDVTPTAAQLAGADAGRPDDADVTLALPGDLPDRIRTLARTITEGASTDGRKALLIQQWLRSAQFSYSLEPAPGSGYQALTQFLFEDHQGYCEQFATSMAVLARAAGIPSRVAVGFLPGSRSGDGWEVSIRDMHAWPELYFAGLGWVSFEPTPGVADPPDYTVIGGPTRSPSASPSASATPSAEPEQPGTEPSADPVEPDTSDTEGVDLTWLAWTGAALAVVALLAAPAAVRHRRRLRRLSVSAGREAVTAAWDEVRDSVWDAGGAWPTGSPRQIADRLAADLPADAADALGRVALLVERARYAENLGEVGDVGADVVRIRSGLTAGTDGPQTWGRKLLPRSLWRRLWWRG